MSCSDARVLAKYRAWLNSDISAPKSPRRPSIRAASEMSAQKVVHPEEENGEFRQEERWASGAEVTIGKAGRASRRAHQEVEAPPRSQQRQVALQAKGCRGRSRRGKSGRNAGGNPATREVLRRTDQLDRVKDQVPALREGCGFSLSDAAKSLTPVAR